MFPSPISRTYPQDLRGGFGIDIGREGGTLTVSLNSESIAGPEVIIPTVGLSSVVAALPQALADVIASLSLTPPDQPGVLWRNQTFPAISPNADGTPYVAPYGAGLSESGAVDPIMALLAVAVPRAIKALPSTPPATPGTLWRNGLRVALTPGADGNAYPTTPMPVVGTPLLLAIRSALPAWLANTVPALPLFPALSSGALWRTGDHSLALSL